MLVLASLRQSYSLAQRGKFPVSYLAWNELEISVRRQNYTRTFELPLNPSRRIHDPSWRLNPRLLRIDDSQEETDLARFLGKGLPICLVKIDANSLDRQISETRKDGSGVTEESVDNELSANSLNN